MKMFEDRIIIDPEIRHGKPVIKTELADSRTKVLLYIYTYKKIEIIQELKRY